MRRRFAIALACAAAACALAAPAAAAPSFREFGEPSGFALKDQTPDCPTACQAIAQVTGYQTQLGSHKNPLRITKSGWIVAFTVRLAQPNPDQITFFKNTYGGKPTARLAVIRSLHTKRKFKLYKQSQTFDFTRYIGSKSTTIVLRQPFRVTKDAIIALTVPTWLPAFAHNLSKDQTWRSSHTGSDCTSSSPPPGAHEKIGSTVTYGCFYRTARLLYSATFVADPTPTSVAKSR